jgi:nicotinamide-nucleotide amidase
MKAEIISIGTELLLGHIINTNPSTISKKLAECGIDVYYHTAVGDNEARLMALLKSALKRSDIVITTGGLGPTVDDITVATVATTIGRKLVYKKQIANKIKRYFSRRHISCARDSFRQAYIPHGARWLSNGLGTAPGLIIEVGIKTLVCLPGPPRELLPMLEHAIVPYLRRHSAAKERIQSRLIKLVGLPEAAVNKKVKDLLTLKPPTTVGIYTHLGEVHLKITTKASTQQARRRALAAVEGTIQKRLGDFIYGSDDERLESTVGRLLSASGMTLGIAESCTGGLIAHRITNISGSSNYFTMGILAYSNKAKTSELGISPKLLKRYGAVSKATAQAMARGIKNTANADIGIGVTGITGPTGATKNKPVGLVHIALATNTCMIAKKCFFVGSREENKHLASQKALEMLWQYLRKKRAHGKR